MRHHQARGMGPFEIHGHRGVPSLLPENTLEGFELAIALGATALELDVTLSADGVVIVSHEPIADAGLYRLGQKGRASSAHPARGVLGRPWSTLYMADIGRLDAGSPGWLGAAPDPFVDTRRPIVGARVPTLDAVVRRHGLASRSRLRSFDWRVLLASRRAVPELQTVALVRIDTATTGSSWMRSVPFRHGRWAAAVTSAARDTGAVAVAPADAVVDAEFMTASARAGLAVLPWTVNSADRVRELVALGANGVTTDHPGMVRCLVASTAAAQRSPGSRR